MSYEIHLRLFIRSFVKNAWKFIFSKPKKLTSSPPMKTRVSLSHVKIRHGYELLLYSLHEFLMNFIINHKTSVLKWLNTCIVPNTLYNFYSFVVTYLKANLLLPRLYILWYITTYELTSYLLIYHEVICISLKETSFFERKASPPLSEGCLWKVGESFENTKFSFQLKLCFRLTFCAINGDQIHKFLRFLPTLEYVSRSLLLLCNV